MYKNIHRKLTLLFTGISAVILIAMSVCYLLLAERDLRQNQFLSFQAGAGTIISNLEQLSPITHEWISKVSANEHYTIALYDRDVPITYTTIALSQKEQALALEILSTLGVQDPPSSEYLSPHHETDYTASDGTHYYVSTARLHSGTVLAVIFSPQTAIRQQLFYLRIRIALLDAAGVFLLLLFCHCYTGKLLLPIQESQNKQNEFISAISHELRTPLAVILSSISAAKKVRVEEKQTLYQTVERESEQMAVLVNDMLTLAGADSHTWRFCMQPSDLDTLLLDVYESFLPLAIEKQVNLRILLPEDAIPEYSCDAGRISQMLGIFLSNAMSYGCREESPEHDTSGSRITLKLSYHASCFFLSVSDNGPGIPADKQAHIFDRFYRGEDSRSVKEHFGLGLSIAKEIADAHQGTISLSETPGGGCTFTVRLPENRKTGTFTL